MAKRALAPAEPPRAKSARVSARATPPSRKAAADKTPPKKPTSKGGSSSTTCEEPATVNLGRRSQREAKEKASEYFRNGGANDGDDDEDEDDRPYELSDASTPDVPRAPAAGT